MKLYLSFLMLLILSFDSIGQDNNEQPWKKYNYNTFDWQNTIDSIIKINPNNAYLWQQKAMPYFKNGDYYNGMKNLNQAVKLDTASWLGYRGFMKCIFLKDYTNAITDFKQIIKKQPNAYEMDHSYYFYIGISYLKLNSLDSAEKYLNVCLSKPKERTHYLDWYYSGILKFKQDNHIKALEYFEVCLNESSRLNDANFYKANVLLSLNRKEEAYSCLIKSKEDNKAGYSLNEDNMIYVDYPFQVRIDQIEDLLKNSFSK